MEMSARSGAPPAVGQGSAGEPRPLVREHGRGAPVTPTVVLRGYTL